jgi:trehalose 6-phosphate phosphatase
LFLDVDGTLVDFVDQPDQLRASPRLVRLLEGLRRASDGALVLVSGRTIESVDAIFEPLRLPVAGLHGHERRDALGNTHRPPVDERALSGARRRFDEVVDRHPGTFVEEKGQAIALHYRQAEAATSDVEKLAAELEAELPAPFCVQRGKMVVEVRSCDHSKGSAIEAFMNEPGFESRIPVFVGDDATDEYGFRWVNDHGGSSIKVGPGESAARFRLESVEQVLGWLDEYLRFLRKNGIEHAS